MPIINEYKRWERVVLELLAASAMPALEQIKGVSDAQRRAKALLVKLELTESGIGDRQYKNTRHSSI